MSFTTKQAGNALCQTANNLRKYRHEHGLGQSMGMGNLVEWTMDDLNEIARRQADRWNLPKWDVVISVEQLDGPPIVDTINVWAVDEEIMKSKASAWFWNALLKEYPEKWGTPAGLEILGGSIAKETPEIEQDEDILTFP